MTQTETPRHQAPAGTPVVCGHRGFKSKYPENTLLSFNSTVSDADVRVIETDVQLSKDRVVVINHDVDTERVYGQLYRIAETNYDPELKLLKNLSPPHESLLTLNRALKWLLRKNQEVGLVKFFLDIKGVNPVEILDLIITEMLKVDPDLSTWHDKIIFGLWSVPFYTHAIENHLLDHFEIFNITFSLQIARDFVALSTKHEQEDPHFAARLAGVSLCHIATWGANYDDLFIKFYELLINKLQRKLFLWTCNDLQLCLFYQKLGVSGYLTDHPDKLRELVGSVATLERPLNLYEFYRKNDPINFSSKKGLKNYATYKVYKSFEFAILRGYLSYKVPVVDGGNKTLGQHLMFVLRYLGIV